MTEWWAWLIFFLATCATVAITITNIIMAHKLNKTIPERVTHIVYDDVRDGGVYECPTCRHTLFVQENTTIHPRTEEMVSHCPNCGQVLDWSGVPHYE